jgi:hypothetical protein
LFAGGVLAIRAAQQANPNNPIGASDPVGAGFVASLQATPSPGFACCQRKAVLISLMAEN